MMCISLENEWNQKCELQFQEQEQMLNWKEAIEADAKRLKALSDVNNQEE